MTERFDFLELEFDCKVASEEYAMMEELISHVQCIKKYYVEIKITLNLLANISLFFSHLTMENHRTLFTYCMTLLFINVISLFQ